MTGPLTVVGARPQFIKTFAVSRALRPDHEDVLVHTGQHYDEELPDVFFEELGIPDPDYNLGVGSGSHGAQTAVMIEGLESVGADAAAIERTLRADRDFDEKPTLYGDGHAAEAIVEVLERVR